jgi:hypothetical protein
MDKLSGTNAPLIRFFHDFGEKLNKEGGRVAQFSEEKEEMTE